MSETNDYIYIVLECSHTLVGKIAKKVEHYDYSHITTCFSDSLDSFASFSRRKLHAPFDAGFMRETLDCMAFGDYDTTQLKIFKVPLLPGRKEIIEKFIAAVERDDQYIFNVYSAFSMGLFHGFRIYKTYNCMSFVGRVLDLSGTVKLDRPYYRYDIRQMDELLTPYLYAEQEYECREIINQHYMDHVGFLPNVGMFLKLTGRLLFRLLTKRKQAKEDILPQ